MIFRRLRKWHFLRFSIDLKILLLEHKSYEKLENFKCKVVHTDVES